MGAVLLTAGAKGKRNALPNARIMIHQPLGRHEGTATEIQIHVKEFLQDEEAAERDPGASTPARPLDQIEKDTDRDNFMAAAGGQGLRADRQRAGADAGGHGPTSTAE